MQSADTTVQPVRMMQPVALQVFAVVLAIGAAVSGVAVMTVSPPGLWWLVVVLVIPLVAAGIRMARLGVLLFPDHLVVRGYFASRTIPRAAITGIRDAGYIEWTDAGGVPRETPVAAFAASSSSPSGARWRYQRDGITALHRWSGAGPDRSDQRLR